MKTQGNVQVVFEGKEIPILWQICQYYHEIEDNNSTGIPLKEEADIFLFEKIHSLLWHISNTISMERQTELSEEMERARFLAKKGIVEGKTYEFPRSE